MNQLHEVLNKVQTKKVDMMENCLSSQNPLRKPVNANSNLWIKAIEAELLVQLVSGA